MTGMGRMESVEIAKGGFVGVEEDGVERVKEGMGSEGGLIIKLTVVPSFALSNSKSSLLSPIAFPLRIHLCCSGRGAVRENWRYS